MLLTDALMQASCVSGSGSGPDMCRHAGCGDHAQGARLEAQEACAGKDRAGCWQAKGQEQGYGP